MSKKKDPTLGPVAIYIPPEVLEKFYDSQPPPDMKEAMHEAFIGPRDRETLVNCPACTTCPVCRGAGMVRPVIAAEYKKCTEIDLVCDHDEEKSNAGHD